MASCAPFVNYRAFAQSEAWRTYYESQEVVAVANEQPPNGDGETRAETAAVTRGGKRERGLESPEGERRSGKKVQLGKHEGRLTQTLAPYPPGSTPIAVPTYNGRAYDSDWNPDPAIDMGGTKRGFKPTNTLGNPSAQAPKNNGGYYGHTEQYNKLETSRVVGANVPRMDRTFEQHQESERSAKKPKLRHSDQTLPPSSPHVDLTGDGEPDVFAAIPIPRTKTIGGTMSSQPTKMRPTNIDDSFSTGEAKRAASFTRPNPPSQSARRRNGNYGSSQRSSGRGSARSHSLSQDDIGDDRTGTKRSPMRIDDDGGKQRIPIVLDDGFEEIKAKSSKAKSRGGRGSQQDLQTANAMLSTVRHTDRAPPMLPKRAQPGGPTDGSQRGAKLNEIFKRDNPTHSSKIKDRMREDSRPSMGEESSPDQLSGGTNVPGHSSPLKKDNGLPRSSAKSSIAQQQPSSPHGAHRQYEATVASSPSDSSDEAGGNADEFPDEGRIPIRSIFSKQCWQEQKRLALVWDADGKQFFVACDEVKVRLPNRASLVSIGKSDVSVSWTSNRSIPKAMLKGSATDVSNGTTLIEFETMRGLSDCADCLAYATGDTMKTVNFAADNMEKHFSNMSNQLREAHRKLWLVPERVSAFTTISRRAGAQVAQHYQEDQILYEDDSSTSNAVQTQQHGRATPVTSQYFTDDSTRKSTRQVKPAAVKRRSPTPPPRWSHENELPQWSHPVVYPSNGARRVTVFDSDLVRLDEGEFLNDNLLGFAIRYIEETMKPVHKHKVHFFNTFFYSCLMKNTRKIDYEAVKRWTKNTDIFTMPYTIVPINNNLHWYFAIMCNLQHLDRNFSGADEHEDDARADVPGVTARVVINDEADEEVLDQAEQMDQHIIADGGEDSEVFVFNEDGTVAQAEGAASLSRPSTATGKKSKKSKQKAAPPTRKYHVNTPVIIMLDSFGYTRTAESTNLKKYIKAEAKEKREMDIDIGQIQGLNAKGMPQQPNFCDCGVFVIGYLMQFAKDPDTFVEKVLRRELDAETDFKDFSASKIRNDIRQTLFDIQKEQAKERQAHKLQKRAKTAQPDTPGIRSKQASPAPSLQTSQATPAVSRRTTPAPVTSPSKSHRSTPFLTSQTVPLRRSSPAQTTHDEDAEGQEEELEVSPPKPLLPAKGAFESEHSSSSSSDSDSESDEEMLDVVPVDDHGTSNTIPANPSAPRAADSLTALPSSKASAASSVADHRRQDGDDEGPEIEDSQGRGCS